jgi:thioredoxin-dependent peroxiredoxin
MTIQLGSQAPDFSLSDQTGQTHTLLTYRGEWILLYFYPKDDTPGCTTEACKIRDSWELFQDTGIVVLGVSPDSIESHQAFAQKYHLQFPLLSDPDRRVAEMYGTKALIGIHRHSFLIDPDGNIAREYRDVNPTVHAQEIIAAVVELRKTR